MSDNAPRNHVEFYTFAAPNPRKTQEEGRPIFDDREMVRIKIPGDRRLTIEAPANEKFRRDISTNEWVTYKDEYPRHYELFKKGMEQVGTGTPISELTFLTEAKRAELRALNILTAEHLAGLDGSNLGRLGMGGRALKDQAQAYLDKASQGAGVSKLAADNEELRRQVEAMQAQMQAFMAQGNAPTPAPMKPVTADETAPASTFEDWSDESLKTFIKERSGTAPRGNPSHATLIRMCDEIHAQEVSDEQAA